MSEKITKPAGNPPQPGGNWINNKDIIFRTGSTSPTNPANPATSKTPDATENWNIENSSTRSSRIGWIFNYIKNFFVGEEPVTAEDLAKKIETFYSRSIITTGTSFGEMMVFDVQPLIKSEGLQQSEYQVLKDLKYFVEKFVKPAIFDKPIENKDLIENLSINGISEETNVENNGDLVRFIQSIQNFCKIQYPYSFRLSGGSNNWNKLVVGQGTMNEFRKLLGLPTIQLTPSPKR